MMNGIDVSKWQDIIDWPKVKAAGVQFAILRAGYGTTGHDIQFERNMSGTAAVGMPAGVYWYSYATTVDAAKAEAAACLAALKGRKLALPVFFDQEYEKSILALSSQQRTNIVNTFLNAIKAAGYAAGLYSSADFIKTKLIDSQIPPDAPRWIAQYASKCTYGGKLYIWQNSSKGRIAGISGNVDTDIYYGDVKKSTAEIAQEVLAGKWGNGQDRKNRLSAAGYNYSDVQQAVNKLLAPKRKSIDQVAREVIEGKWGNGKARIDALEKAGYDPDQIQRRVNELLRR